MPPWLKEIEDHLEKAKQPLSIMGNFDDIKLEPGKIELTPDRFVVDVDRLLELAKRAIEMAEYYAWADRDDGVPIELSRDSAREFLEWVKEGK